MPQPFGEEERMTDKERKEKKRILRKRPLTRQKALVFKLPGNYTGESACNCSHVTPTCLVTSDKRVKKRETIKNRNVIPINGKAKRNTKDKRRDRPVKRLKMYPKILLAKKDDGTHKRFSDMG